MKPPGPILVADLFPLTLESLLELLSSLEPDEWNLPTVCGRWSVKDIASHLLGGEIGIQSRKRDGHTFSGKPIADWNELVALINELNDVWVRASARLSPRVLCDLLRLTGEQTCEYFKSLDPFASGEPVNWAGPAPAPVWLDVAREYTERWHHQQQIRDAVGKPGLKEPKFFAPVIDAFVRALPHTYRNIEAEIGTSVALNIAGDSGGRWIVQREEDAWHLYVADHAQPADAEVVLDQDIAWRLFTKGIKSNDALRNAKLIGRESLAMKALEMVSVIA